MQSCGAGYSSFMRVRQAKARSCELDLEWTGEKEGCCRREMVFLFDSWFCRDKIVLITSADFFVLTPPARVSLVLFLTPSADHWRKLDLVYTRMSHNKLTVQRGLARPRRPCSLRTLLSNGAFHALNEALGLLSNCCLTPRGATRPPVDRPNLTPDCRAPSSDLAIPGYLAYGVPSIGGGHISHCRVSKLDLLRVDTTVLSLTVS